MFLSGGVEVNAQNLLQKGAPFYNVWNLYQMVTRLTRWDEKAGLQELATREGLRRANWNPSSKDLNRDEFAIVVFAGCRMERNFGLAALQGCARGESSGLGAGRINPAAHAQF